MGDDTSKAYPTIADSSSNSNDGTITNGASDDIVQQMVAGYDMGAFESSSEELGGDFARAVVADSWTAYTNMTVNSITGGVSIVAPTTASGDSVSGNGAYIYFRGATFFGENQLTTKDLEIGKTYSVTFNAFYSGGASGVYVDIYNSSSSVFSDALTTTNTSYTMVFEAKNATTGLVRFQQIKLDNTVYITDITVKEVLQSADLSDTYPAIIDVNEPVLGVELVDANTSSGWSAYGSNTVANVTNGVKITHVDNAGGAQGNFTDAGLLNADQTSGKTYKVKFNAYYSGGTAPNVKIWTGALNQGTQALTTSEKEYIIYFKNAGASSLYFDSVNGSQEIYILNLSTKEVSGNVGTMTQMDGVSNLVYSSVLPDQSFLTGVNSAYNFLDFDGTDDLINIGSDASIDNIFVGGATIMAWIKPSSDGENDLGRIFDKSDATSGDEGWHFLVRSESGGVCDLRFAHGWSTTQGRWDTDNREVNINEWNHVAITYDNSSVSNNASIFVNGISVAVDEDVTPSGTVADDSSRNLFIGNNTGGDRSFAGGIAGIALWGKSLSALEISAIYTAGRHFNLLDNYSDNLKAYFACGLLDATSGFKDTSSTIYDRSGNSNHGTVSGATLQSPPNAEPNGYAKGDTNRSTTIP